MRTKCPKAAVHYWIIETPHGPTSKGVCKYCNEVREFDNWWPEYILRKPAANPVCALDTGRRKPGCGGKGEDPEHREAMLAADANST